MSNEVRKSLRVSYRRRQFSLPSRRRSSSISRASNIYDTDRKFNRDNCDVPSLNPSYTNFRIPYAITCINRYRDAKRKYERQFKHEIQKLLEVQPNGFELAKFYRAMSITSLWPPMHNRRELKNLRTNVFNTHQQARVYYLMENKIE